MGDRLEHWNDGGNGPARLGAGFFRLRACGRRGAQSAPPSAESDDQGGVSWCGCGTSLVQTEQTQSRWPVDAESADDLGFSSFVITGSKVVGPSSSFERTARGARHCGGRGTITPITTSGKDFTIDHKPPPPHLTPQTHHHHSPSSRSGGGPLRLPQQNERDERPRTCWIPWSWTTTPARCDGSHPRQPG